MISLKTITIQAMSWVHRMREYLEGTELLPSGNVCAESEGGVGGYNK